jgi:hypothetical protein
MLLFSRVVTLTGSPRRAVPWAIGMTDYVNAQSELDVSLWSGSFGYPLGTFAWSTVVESEVALADATAKLLVDEGYYDQLEKGQDLISQPGQDFLRELLHGEPAEPPPIGAVATLTTATALVDRMADAIGWGVEIAQFVTDATGTPVSLLSNLYGQMGELVWIAVQPDLAAAEAVRARLNTNTEYLGRLVATKDLFITGSGRIAQARRIA